MISAPTQPRSVARGTSACILIRSARRRRRRRAPPPGGRPQPDSLVGSRTELRTHLGHLSGVPESLPRSWGLAVRELLLAATSTSTSRPKFTGIYVGNGLRFAEIRLSRLKKHTVRTHTPRIGHPCTPADQRIWLWSPRAAAARGGGGGGAHYVYRQMYNIRQLLLHAWPADPVPQKLARVTVPHEGRQMYEGHPNTTGNTGPWSWQPENHSEWYWASAKLVVRVRVQSRGTSLSISHTPYLSPYEIPS
jgi:hypothetical protein